MSGFNKTLTWIECETPGCYQEEAVADDVTAVKCWRCSMGQVEHLRKQEGEYLSSVAPSEIKRARKRAGFTQQVLAFKLNTRTHRVSQVDVSQAECGKADPPNKKIIDWVLEQRKAAA